MYSMMSNQRVYHTYKKSLASATDRSLLKFIIGANVADAMTRRSNVIYAHMCMHDDHELVVRHAWMHTPSPYLRGWSVSKYNYKLFIVRSACNDDTDDLARLHRSPSPADVCAEKKLPPAMLVGSSKKGHHVLGHVGETVELVRVELVQRVPVCDAGHVCAVY
jgi:hypothetical protein